MESIVEDKNVRMRKIAREIRHLEESPLYDYRQEHGYKPVMGEGNLDAEIMFIGEAPGAREAQVGCPFVGRSGQVLNRLLISAGIDREDVYITNVLKDRPPKNRDPRAQEIEIYAPFLEKEIALIQPQVIATLGRFAMNYILEHFDLPQKDQNINDLCGEILEAKEIYGTINIVPLYHPAAMFYNRGLEQVMEESFEVLKQFA